MAALEKRVTMADKFGSEYFVSLQVRSEHLSHTQQAVDRSRRQPAADSEIVRSRGAKEFPDR